MRWWIVDNPMSHNMAMFTAHHSPVYLPIKMPDCLITLVKHEAFVVDIV